MEEILSLYYRDNARKLRGTVDRILSGFGGLWEKDADDFYSLANEVFADVCRRYDRSQSFDGFLYACLSNRIKSEMTKRGRQKRRAERTAVSIDEYIAGDEGITLGDVLADGFDMEKAVIEELSGEKQEYSGKVMRYLGRLSRIQREVLRLRAEGYVPGEIRRELHLSEKQYEDCNRAIRSQRNTSVLF